MKVVKWYQKSIRMLTNLFAKEVQAALSLTFYFEEIETHDSQVISGSLASCPSSGDTYRLTNTNGIFGLVLNIFQTEMKSFEDQV